MFEFARHLNLWLTWLVVGVVALVLLVIAGFFVALLAACLWEKQRVRDFVPVSPDAIPSPSPYFKAMSDAARELGFQPGGLFGQDRKSSMYRCYLGLWLSADRISMLCIAAGKVARTNYRKTMLVSKMPGDKCLATLDLLGTQDLSGTMHLGALVNADLYELNELHLRRLSSSGFEPLPFFAGNLMADFEGFRRLQAERLVARGIAKFLSPDCNVWRYKPRGAWQYVIAASFKDFPQLRAQADRAKKKRPGG